MGELIDSRTGTVWATDDTGHPIGNTPIRTLTSEELRKHKFSQFYGPDATMRAPTPNEQRDAELGWLNPSRWGRQIATTAGGIGAGLGAAALTGSAPVSVPAIGLGLAGGFGANMLYQALQKKNPEQLGTAPGAATGAGEAALDTLFNVTGPLINKGANVAKNKIVQALTGSAFGEEGKTVLREGIQQGMRYTPGQTTGNPLIRWFEDTFGGGTVDKIKRTQQEQLTDQFGDLVTQHSGVPSNLNTGIDQYAKSSGMSTADFRKILQGPDDTLLGKTLAASEGMAAQDTPFLRESFRKRAMADLEGTLKSDPTGARLEDFKGAFLEDLFKRGNKVQKGSTATKWEGSKILEGIKENLPIFNKLFTPEERSGIMSTAMRANLLDQPEYTLGRRIVSMRGGGSAITLGGGVIGSLLGKDAASAGIGAISTLSALGGGHQIMARILRNPKLAETLGELSAAKVMTPELKLKTKVLFGALKGIQFAAKAANGEDSAIVEFGEDGKPFVVEYPSGKKGSK